MYSPYGVRPEHALLLEKNLGYKIPHGYVVHHIDGNVKNNDLSNLKLFKCHGEHRTEHARKRIIDAGGDPDKQKICSRCKKLLPKSEFYLSRRLNGYGEYTLTGYCKPCSNYKHDEWCKKNYRDKRENKNGFRE